MKTSLIRLIALSLATLPVAALAADYASADGNGDGMLSLEEVQAILPDVTTDMFLTIDADGDGLLNQEELAAAQADGVLPAADG